MAGFPVVQPPPRKARIQMTTTTRNKLDGTRAAKEGGIYNIWYNRMSMVDVRNANRDQVAFTRCNPELDSGVTRGSETRPDTTFCIHFARGSCAKGYDCNYLHRIPDETDESFIHRGIDCFGRERERDDRDDMNGTGSFDRENTTLYIGRVATYDDPEEVLERHFGVFGPIRSIKCLHTRNVGFVKYESRLTAEFAKEAMDQQSLDNNECLVVRWATEDPNPKAKKETKEEFEARFVKQVLADPKKQRELLHATQTDQDLNAYYQTGDTSASAAPWAPENGGGDMLPPPPPPPPPKKKSKKKSVAGKAAATSESAIKPSSLLSKDSVNLLATVKESSVTKAVSSPPTNVTMASGLVAYDSD